MPGKSHLEFSSHSVTQLIDQLKAGGNESAAEQLWQRYFSQLVRVAKRQLGGLRATVEDEQDIANMAFYRLCEGAKQGRFGKLDNRDDFWRLLIHIAGQKTIDTKKKALAKKRGGGEARGESVFEGPSADRGIENFAPQEPTPEELAEINDLINQLLASLEREDVKRVILLRLEGFTVEEISQQLETSISSIERKLRLVRDSWTRIEN